MSSLTEKIKAKQQAALKKEKEKKKIQQTTKIEEEKKIIAPKELYVNYFDLPDYQGFLEYVRAHPEILKDLCLEDKPTKKNPNPVPFDKVANVWKHIVGDTITVYRKIIKDILQGKW